MAGKGTHVVIPDEVVARQIDRLVGKRGRSKFLVSAARTEVKRLRLLSPQDASGSWKDEDHPELQNGAARWVSKLRWQDNNRARTGLSANGCLPSRYLGNHRCP